MGGGGGGVGVCEWVGGEEEGERRKVTQALFLSISNQVLVFSCNMCGSLCYIVQCVTACV